VKQFHEAKTTTKPELTRPRWGEAAENKPEARQRQIARCNAKAEYARLMQGSQKAMW